MRRIPYPPIFSSTPARIMLIGVGASTWASGNQVWNGKTGTLIAKPTNRNRNMTYWNVGVKKACCSRARLALGRDACHHGLPFLALGRIQVIEPCLAGLGQHEDVEGVIFNLG